MITLIFLLFFTQNARGERSFEVLHDVGATPPPPPSSPSSALIESADGNFYGTTWQGGAVGLCVVSRLVPTFLRGECNDDGEIDITDALCSLDSLFSSNTTSGCIAALNTNGDEAVDISDAVWLLSFLFVGGPPPAEPYPECRPGLLAAEAGTCETPQRNCPQ